MSVEVTISRHDVFLSDGKHSSTCYEIKLEEDREQVLTFSLEYLSDLKTLRDALSNYIKINQDAHEQKTAD